jgi:xyloglucan-specific endo-beta-1,4-glucanase
MEYESLHRYVIVYRLGRYGGVQPIGTKQGSATIEGHTWELWVGPNGSMKVFSFVAANPITDFNADIKQFFNYLQKAQGFPAESQHLLSIYNSSFIHWIDY